MELGGLHFCGIAGDPCSEKKAYIFHVTNLVWEASTVTRKIFLGPNETSLLFGLEKEGKAVFSFEDATRILGSSKMQ